VLLLMLLLLLALMLVVVSLLCLYARENAACLFYNVRPKSGLTGMNSDVWNCDGSAGVVIVIVVVFEVVVVVRRS
jgi:hypothetical protein